LPSVTGCAGRPGAHAAPCTHGPAPAHLPETSQQWFIRWVAGYLPGYVTIQQMVRTGILNGVGIVLITLAMLALAGPVLGVGLGGG
jgi:hypothetical protein